MNETSSAKTARGTLDDMADEYSRRAREARVQQGLTAVVTSPKALGDLSDILSAPVSVVSAPTDDAA